MPCCIVTLDDAPNAARGAKRHAYHHDGLRLPWLAHDQDNKKLITAADSARADRGDPAH
jgi:hypothetical protein